VSFESPCPGPHFDLKAVNELDVTVGLNAFNEFPPPAFQLNSIALFVSFDGSLRLMLKNVN